ncbi:MAG: VIT1/CCC1 transporter family protein [Candidatus Helarchaeota archaeon]
MEIDNETKNFILKLQKNEITEHHIYLKLAKKQKKSHNRQVLESIAQEELEHYNIWRQYTKTDVKPNKSKIRRYLIICKIFGLTFGIKKMENGEANAQKIYKKIANIILEASKIIDDEIKHENQLIGLIKEDFLNYIGSVVLGLNDALVELTGALAGLTFAFNNISLIAMTALITGIAASLSMGASEYLSTRSENIDEIKSPLKAAIYTGLTYVFTIILLIFPYLILKNAYLCLAISICSGIGLIFVFTYYTSVAKSFLFKKRFIEMVVISLSIAGISFLIGHLVKISFNIDV